MGGVRRVAISGLFLLLLGVSSAFGQDQTAATDAASQAAGDAAAPAAHPAVPVVPQHLAGTYDTGSIAWLLVSAALVFFMMPGLALFYGGMVRAKNLLNMFMCVMGCSNEQLRDWEVCGRLATS